MQVVVAFSHVLQGDEQAWQTLFIPVYPFMQVLEHKLLYKKYVSTQELQDS